ncbi:MAG: S-adenosylmethionine decarboxylase [Flavobacteriales bacterium]|jgi:S-adenosylmethionine decarboxylase
MKAELYNFNCWIKEHKPGELKSNLEALLKESGFTILGFIDHHFEPQGYTSIWLLSESHLAIHTYPEHNKSYVELTSCVASKLILFKKLLTSKFEETKSD